MSVQSQKKSMGDIAVLLSQDLGYIYGERENGPNGAKKQFLTKSAVFLRALGKDLNFKEIRVNTNPAGIAVSGEVTLYGIWNEGNGVMLEMTQPYNSSFGLMYRSISRIDDYRGGQNKWLGLDVFKRRDYECLCDTLFALKNAGEQNKVPANEPKYILIKGEKSVMKKITSFKIIELSVEGFKRFTEKQTFRFDDLNIISGHPSQGKSSIADAIAYAVAGVPFFGSEQNLDRLYDMNSRNVTVEMTVQIEDGSVHKLVRNRSNDVTGITYDGISVRQSDLTVMFGERDVFLSAINPLYFIEVLGDKGRNLLERYLPEIPHETILAGLSEPIRALLENENMNSPETLLGKIREAIKENENTVIYTEGQRDTLESQINDVKKTIRENNDEAAAAANSIAALEVKRVEGLDLTALEKQKADLYKQYDELSKGIIMPADVASIDRDISSASKELEQKRAQVFESKHTQQISEITAQIKKLTELYFSEDGILKGLVPGIQCPTCKQDITEQNIDSVKKSFADSIAAVQKNGREYKARLTELQKLENDDKTAFEFTQASALKDCEEQLETLKTKRAELINKANQEAQSRNEVLDQLKMKIQSLEQSITLGNLTSEEAQILADLQNKRDRLMSETATLTEMLQKFGTDDKTEAIQKLQDDTKSKRELETAVKFYISERIRRKVEKFDRLQRVKIVLYEIVKKTGELKDVFMFSYEDRPYRYLSFSEKIKCGLEVSELIKGLAGCNYPVFIDNGESVPVIDNIRPTGQTFIAHVVKGAQLTVDAKQTAVQLNKAA